MQCGIERILLLSQERKMVMLSGAMRWVGNIAILMSHFIHINMTSGQGVNAVNCNHQEGSKVFPITPSQLGLCCFSELGWVLTSHLPTILTDQSHMCELILSWPSAKSILLEIILNKAEKLSLSPFILCGFEADASLAGTELHPESPIKVTYVPTCCFAASRPNPFQTISYHTISYYIVYPVYPPSSFQILP